MSLNAKNVQGGGGHKQEPLEAGTYPARLVQVLDLGLQKQRPFQGQEKQPAQEIYTTYELLDEFCVDEDGNVQEDRPRWVSERFPFHNLEADRAKSTQRYYAMDPKEEKGGDWVELIGTPVMITLTATEGKNKNKGKIFNNIAAVSAMREKDANAAAELKNPSKVFMIDDPDMEVFMQLPKFLQDIIKDNLNYGGSDLEEAIDNYKAPEKDADDKSEDKDADVKEEENTDDDW